MIKRGLFILLFAILFLSLASASTIRSEFTIAGCSKTSESGRVDIPINSCSGDGSYFCNASGVLQDTRSVSKACSLGRSSYSAGQSRCCPVGYVCDPQTLICELGGAECGNYDESQSSCENAGCFYEVESSSCVSSPSEYSCGIYQSQNACSQDTYNLGKQGFGTEVCSKTFTVGSDSYVVPGDSCKCVWSQNKCQLQWKFVESIYGTAPNSYMCNTTFDFGTCQNGVQRISWTAIGFGGTGAFSGSISEAALSAPGCKDGGVDKVCGAPTIKFPGFSWIAGLLVILGLIGFYVLRRK